MLAFREKLLFSFTCAVARVHVLLLYLVASATCCGRERQVVTIGVFVSGTNTQRVQSTGTTGDLVRWVFRAERISELWNQWMYE